MGRFVGRTGEHWVSYHGHLHDRLMLLPLLLLLLLLLSMERQILICAGRLLSWRAALISTMSYWLLSSMGCAFGLTSVTMIYAVSS